jgi:hypothetical protein
LALLHFKQNAQLVISIMRSLWFVLLSSLVYTTGVETFGSPGHARLLAEAADGSQWLLPDADATFNPQPVISTSKQTGSCGYSSPTYSTSHTSSFSATAAPVHGDDDSQGIPAGEAAGVSPAELITKLDELCKLIEEYNAIPSGDKAEKKSAARRLRSGRTFLNKLLLRKVF